MQLIFMRMMLLVMLGSTVIAASPLMRETFSTLDAKVWTPQPPLNARGPIPANGAWAAANGELVATGSAAPWTVLTAGGAGWTDYRLSAKVTIRQPAPIRTGPIHSSQFDRFEPIDPQHPNTAHAEQFRYRYYAGEFDWGSDAALYFRYQDRLACYRVQLSTEFQEVILWHGTGGYLQVVPCKLEVGKTYSVEVVARGAHFQVSVNGKRLIDYWHESLPTLAGGIGLGAYHSTVGFREVTVAALPEADEAMPTHQPKFTTRKWRTLRWIFDGNEPITLLEKESSQDDSYLSKALFYHFTKLRPGYRPTFYGWVAILIYPHMTQLVGDEWTGVNTAGEGSAKLILTFDSVTPEETLRAGHTIVLTYDRAHGTYRHDVTVDMTWLKDQTHSYIEFTDPFTYNNKAPGRGVKYPWLPAGHEWGLFPGEDGMLYRHPISEATRLEPMLFNNWQTRKDSAFWLLYPDRAVCPIWEHHNPGEQSGLGVCHWGYDWHQDIVWEKGRNFKAGEKMTVKYAHAGLRPHEAERLFQRSRLHPDSDKPEATGPGTFATIVPTPYAFPLCNPAGTDFAELQSVREPYLGWHFWGEYVVDREIGHNDRYSLRMDGPGSVNGMMYHHMLDTHTEQYLCTVWVKTKNVRGGKGPIITLKYSYADTPRDIVETGMLGDNDWREISFISTVPLTHESSDIIFELDGSGIAWFDDFSLRPIEAGEKVAEKRPAPIAVALPEPVKDLLLDLPCDEGEGLQCVDRSNRGNTVRLLGATWAHTEKRAVLRFAPNTGAFVLRPSPEFSPKTLDGVKGFGLSAMTLEAWIRPAPSTEAGAILGYYYSPVLYLQPAGKEKFSLNLMATPSKGRRVVATSPALIPANEWTHVAATLMTNGSIRLYVNGKQVLDTPFEGMLSSSANHHYISLGVMGKFYGYPYHGDMANLRWWARAATDEEIAAAVAQRP